MVLRQGRFFSGGCFFSREEVVRDLVQIAKDVCELDDNLSSGDVLKVYTEFSDKKLCKEVNMVCACFPEHKLIKWRW